MKNIHPEMLAQIKKVKGKRPLTVINHILEHGQITTEELKNVYGYNHPPRAIRDVRECGIPLDMHRVVGSDGRKIAAYTFGNPDKVERHKLGGRKTFPKAFKELLLKLQGAKCALTGEPYHHRYLSIDHRIPYEVAGDQVATIDQPECFMLISATAQRRKSWSCEHCNNWIDAKNLAICRRCYWVSPEDYDHIATEERRRIDLHWIGRNEVSEFEALKSRAGDMDALRKYIKMRLKSANS